MKAIEIILLVIPALIAALILGLLGVYFTRLKTIRTIEKLTSYKDGFDLYRMTVKFDYDLDSMLSREYSDNNMVAKAILGKTIPYLPIRMESPDYSCSAFSVTDTEGAVLMGRNYDFDVDTSALMVCCAPKNGYRSVAMAALDHVGVTSIDGLISKVSTLPAPYICLDGMNEKGVSISILMLDSEPVVPATPKPDLFTTLAVRLVLDRAASTQEAVDLMRSYDMFSVSGGDYHFFITDASGDGRVIEYDCQSETRELIDTPVRTATNFYQIYIDKVLPDQYNGIYGHGRERYDIIEKMLTENEGRFSEKLAWETLRAAQQLPTPKEKTSNTQWSVVYNNTKLTAGVTLRRKWGDVTSYSLADNAITGRVQSSES